MENKMYIGEVLLEPVKVKVDEGGYMPSKAYKYDAGFDLYSPVDVVVPARGHVNIDTRVHIAIPEGYTGFLKSRSGMNTKHGITSEGVIDAQYRGTIVVCLRNNTDTDYEVFEGNKITQIVILPIYCGELELVNDLDETERGEKGFGSTGR